MARTNVALVFSAVALSLGSAGDALALGLTPAGKRAAGRAEIVVAEMDRTRLVVRKQLQGARTRRDAVQSKCLSNDLSQIDAALRDARERLVRLASAADEGEPDRVRLEALAIELARRRVDRLAVDARVCVGEPPAALASNSVVLTIDPGIAEPSDLAALACVDRALRAAPPR